MKNTTIAMLSLVLTLAAGRALAQPEPMEPGQVVAQGQDPEEPGVHVPAPPPAPMMASPAWVATPETSVRLVPIPCPAPVLEDPAAGRLGLFDTAETLGRGQWSFTARGQVTTELAYGVTDWLEVGFKTIPLLLLVPEEGLQNTLYMGTARLRLLKNSWLTLTAETDGLSFLGWAGVRGAVLTRMGGRRAGFHLGVSAMQLWAVDENGWAAPGRWANDGSGEEADTPTKRLVMAQAGVDVRVSRRVKLMLDASYQREDGPGLLLGSPAVRVHGEHFAADFGVAIVHQLESGEGFFLPLVNLSVTY